MRAGNEDLIPRRRVSAVSKDVPRTPSMTARDFIAREPMISVNTLLAIVTRAAFWRLHCGRRKQSSENINLKN